MEERTAERPGPPTDRTRVRRLPERGVYEREAIDAILDEALICHVAYVVDGQPRVIPTIHARDGDVLYVHGSNASRTLRAAKGGAPVAIGVTLLDGLVLARSAFHHSMNYRSVVVFGRARARSRIPTRSGARSRRSSSTSCMGARRTRGCRTTGS
jgi:nitroimidazol reductase NimA-like FMN-containing flavoprotein (pyridoxamine 5'-phosphate oxidase superfamily)